jgi:excisionase family DNA binding protein
MARTSRSRLPREHAREGSRRVNKPRDIPRYTLTRQEAAASLGISLDTFEEHIQHELRLVRVGRLVLVPTRELERWVEKTAALTLESVA